MIARDLKKYLKTVPDDALVILSSDEEGNSFHDLYEVSEDSMQKMGRQYQPNQEGTAKINSIVLWPA